MTFTRNTVARGAGAVVIRRLSDDRLLYLNTNSKYTFNRSLTAGNKIQGFNSDGTLLDLDVASAEETYELEIVSKKNTRNINELMLNSTYVSKTSYDSPWAETAFVSAGAVTLKGGTPVSGTLVMSYLDGTKLTLSAGVPSAGGQFKDNGDGTITLNAADNGKTLVALYKTTLTNVNVQGGADNTAVGYVDVMFHQVSGSSSTGNKKGVDIIWLPKCALLSDASFEFSNDVADKTFKLTGLVPDVPVGFKVPYVIIRDVEIDNTNAG